MISRRSFFTGLAAALVAPKIVRRALDHLGWSVSYTELRPLSNAETALLRQRIADAERIMRENMAQLIYGNVDTTPFSYFGFAPQYTTLRESLLERSEHHFQRAAYWQVQGKPDYAMGSLHKAAVAEDRARSLPA